MFTLGKDGGISKEYPPPPKKTWIEIFLVNKNYQGGGEI